jgi:hypothetical protein
MKEYLLVVSVFEKGTNDNSKFVKRVIGFTDEMITSIKFSALNQFVYNTVDLALNEFKEVIINENRKSNKNATNTK